MSVKPIPPADVQLEHLEEKYAQIRHAMGQVVTSLRIPRECGFALIMALMDMSSVVAKDDGIGHEALQRVLSMDAKNEKAEGLLAALFNFRALAHGASWAASIDRATSQNHDAKHRVLLEELKKQQPQLPPPGQPAPPAGKAGG